MMNCKAAPTPIDAKNKLSSDGPPTDDAMAYHNLAGVLQYVSNDDTVGHRLRRAASMSPHA